MPWRPLMAVMRLLRCSAVSAARTVSCCQPPSGTTPLRAAMAAAACVVLRMRTTADPPLSRTSAAYLGGGEGKGREGGGKGEVST